MLQRSLVGLLMVLAGLCWQGAAQADDIEPFRVLKGDVYRGDDTFQLKAISMPDALAHGAELPAMAPRLARVAEVGGNTLCADLSGFSADARELDPAVAATVAAYAARAKEQRMGMMVRVLAGITDPALRARAVKTAAKALRAEVRTVYLIDGPDAAALAADFKKLAKRCTVAAPEGGDIRLVTSLPETPEKHVAYLLDGAIPPVLNDDRAHFVLPGSEADYAAVEAAMTTEVEKNYQPIDAAMLSEAERAEGFVPLFNGKDLSGWWTYGDNPKGFHVSDCGEIEWVEEGASALISAKRYGDFVLRIEYKLLPGYNSGIYLRAPRAARQSWIGMEFQLHGDAGLKEPNDDCTGALYKQLPPLVVASKPGAEWNQLEIRMEGAHIKATLNGQTAQDTNLDDHPELKHRLRKGFIGLQDHQNYVAFRNIRIKELNP